MTVQGGDHVTAHVASQGVGGATGQRFQRQCAAAGEQVEAAAAFDVHAQPVEQGFTHPVGGGAQARLFGETETSAAPLSSNDAQLTFAGLGLFHSSGSGVLGVSVSGSAASGFPGAVSWMTMAGPTVITSRCSGSKCRAKAARMSSVVSACT